MSWMEGTGPIRDVRAAGISKGLSEDWYSSDSIRTRERREIKQGNYWDIIDNPLYEVAAGALGYDWDEWRAEARSLVGATIDDGTVRVRAEPEVRNPLTELADRIRSGRSYVDVDDAPAEYEWVTRSEAEERGLNYEIIPTTRYRNKETGRIVNVLTPPWQSGPQAAPPGSRGALEEYFLHRRNEGWEDDWEELRDWGVHNAVVIERLDELSDWLGEIVNINDNLHPIIREGPKGEHYGIAGDIWEHYGLDQEPEPPEELDWDSYDERMQLSTAVASDVSYSTPEGITPVDLHGD